MAALTLRDIPDDVYNLIIQKQAEIKSKKKTAQFSLEKTVYIIIRSANISSASNSACK